MYLQLFYLYILFCFNYFYRLFFILQRYESWAIWQNKFDIPEMQYRWRAWRAKNTTYFSISKKIKKSGAPLEAPLWARKNRIHYITCYCLFLNFTACCLPFEVVMVFFILYVRLQWCRKSGIEAKILTFYLLNFR